MEVAGTILHPGVPDVTLSGQLVSLETDDHPTMALTSADAGLGELSDPSASSAMPTIIANQASTTATSAVAIAGSILTPGAPGKPIIGTLGYLNTARQLVVNSSRIPLESNSAGLGGFPAGGPLSSSTSPLSTLLDGTKINTNTSVQVFQGWGADGSNSFSLWKVVAVSTVAMCVLLHSDVKMVE